MKHLLSALAFCAALPVCAAPLTVNAPATTTPVENGVDYTLSGPVDVAAGMTVLLDADMTFTLPSEDPEAPSGEDKISIMPNKAGEILVSDGNAWAKSGVTVADNETKHVKIVTVQKEGALAFDVTIEGMDTPITVAPTAGGTEFSTLAFEGEGAVNGVAVAAVPTGILPPSADGAQDASLVGKYVTWLNDSDKGGAMKGATETEISDAFAMNVGGTPSLAITDIDVSARTITVAGSYAKGEGEEAVDMGAINGTIYLTYASELGGQAKTAKAEVSVQHDKTAVVNLPDGAVFVKARVALTPPADTTL